jgi:peptidoglycan hydrolase-like protein with peptidoglycan-binding domain
MPASPPAVAGLSGLPGDQDALVGQMQRALTQKGYRVGADNHFDDDTVSALQAFQDSKALTVQPTCDQQCWDALGLADPK